MIEDTKSNNIVNTVIPEGFHFLGKHVSIKPSELDLGVAYSEKVCTCAAVFTKNSICGVSIPIGRNNVKNGELQAIVITSGIANVATGGEGTNNALTITKTLASELNIDANNILPSSTGVIGKQLPIDKILKGLENIKNSLAPENYLEFAKAITTTDTRLKVRQTTVENTTILGIAKGCGMLEPNMATMLVYFFTDAQIDKVSLDAILKKAVNKSFNMISVDTDTSTSDTVAILANGLAGNVDLTLFEDKFTELCIGLAQDVVRDGEGATKLIEVTVENANNFDQAKVIAKSIVNSPLVKTAVYGADPNWGRIIMAVGKVCDASITEDSISIYIGDYLIYDKGTINDEYLNKIQKYLADTEHCIIKINLDCGSSTATVWGCDLTEEYININSSYTS